MVEVLETVSCGKQLGIEVRYWNILYPGCMKIRARELVLFALAGIYKGPCDSALLHSSSPLLLLHTTTPPRDAVIRHQLPSSSSSSSLYITMQHEFQIAIAVTVVILGTPLVGFLLYTWYRGLTQVHDLPPFDVTQPGNINLEELGRRSRNTASLRSVNPSANPSATPSVHGGRKPIPGRTSIQTINRENYDLRDQPNGILGIDLPTDERTLASIPRRYASFQSSRGEEPEASPGHARQRSSS